MNQELDSGDWSDSEDEGKAGPSDKDSDVRLAKKAKKLQAQLSQAHQDLRELKTMLKGRFELLEASVPDAPGIDEAAVPRDDDTHYFESYAYNGGRVFLYDDQMCPDRRAVFRHSRCHDTRHCPNIFLRQVHP